MLLGPFLTEHEFEDRVRAPRGSVREHAFLLRIDGPVGAAYPEFQLAGDTVRPDLAWVVTRMRETVPDDLDICHWMCDPHPRLAGMTPLDWLTRDWPFGIVARAIPGGHGDEAPVRPRASPLPRVA